MKILFLLSSLTVLLTIRAEDYCSSSLCRPGVRHVACGHNGQFSSQCPSNAHLVKLSPAHIKQIVDLHNEKRNEIAGGGLSRYRPAARMATMQWDEELASLAVFNVYQCEMKHDDCRNTKTFKNSGQNLFIQGYYGQSFTDEQLIKEGINDWYIEHKDADMMCIDKYPLNYSGPTIGHFTEMVNSNNTHVGCAASRWNKGGFDYFLFACNYAVTNFRGEPIYKSSPAPASECVSGRNPTFKNLCSIAEFKENTKNANKVGQPVQRPGMYTTRRPNRYPKGNVKYPKGNTRIPSTYSPNYPKRHPPTYWQGYQPGYQSRYQPSNSRRHQPGFSTGGPQTYPMEPSPSNFPAYFY